MREEGLWLRSARPPQPHPTRTLQVVCVGMGEAVSQEAQDALAQPGQYPGGREWRDTAWASLNVPVRCRPFGRSSGELLSGRRGPEFMAGPENPKLTAGSGLELWLKGKRGSALFCVNLRSYLTSVSLSFLI